MRSKPATTDQKLANFEWCLNKALSGRYPPTETGLFPKTIYALRAVADAAIAHQQTAELQEQARAALKAELRRGVARA